MNQSEFNQALKLRKKYNKTAKLFNSRGGIIQPIRATVVDIEETITDCYSNAQIYQKLCRIAYGIATHYAVEDNTCKPRFRQYRIGDLDTFINESHIVGYVASVWDEKRGINTYGLSYCQEKDFDKFNTYFGKTMAMERAMYNPVRIMDVILDEDICNMSSKSKYMYFWPITYGGQLRYFMDRCKRYFKQLEQIQVAKE